MIVSHKNACVYFNEIVSLGDYFVFNDTARRYRLIVSHKNAYVYFNEIVL